MRAVLITVVALIVGVALGVVTARAQFAARLDALGQERDDVCVVLAQTKADGDVLAKRLSVSEAACQARDDEVETLQARVESLQGQMRALEQAAAVPREEVAPAQDAPETPAETKSPAPDAAAEDGRDRRRERSEDLSPEEMARRDEEIRGYRANFQGRMDTFFQDAMNAAPDRASQERIASIQDNIAYLSELREAMRNATTDEERAALRQSMADAGVTLRDLVLSQQDDMLRNLATQFGVKGDKEQQAFVAAVQTLQESPFFHAREYAGYAGMGRGPMVGGGFGGGRPGSGTNR